MVLLFDSLFKLDKVNVVVPPPKLALICVSETWSWKLVHRLMEVLCTDMNMLVHMYMSECPIAFQLHSFNEKLQFHKPQYLRTLNSVQYRQTVYYFCSP